jgi:divalent metal cation (Fe/Co/Zn/Cd) transporter
MADEVRIVPERVPPPTPEPSLGELFKQLTQDTGVLIKQEVALARTEMRENIQSVTRNAVKIAAGGVVAVVGVLVLVAFVVVLLGSLLGNYWLSALIVGLLMVIVGGVMAKKAVDDIKDGGLAPEQTVETLKEDKEWLQNEIRDVRKDLT